MSNSNLSSNSVKEIKYLYESIYEKDTKQSLTEEHLNNILAIELYNALIEDGFIEGNPITEENIREEDFQLQLEGVRSWIVSQAPKLWDLGKNIFKQTTGLGTKPVTTAGRRVRDLQKVTIGALAANPEARSRVGGAISGAAQGAWQGLTKKPQEEPSLQQRVNAFMNPGQRNTRGNGSNATFGNP